MGKSMTGRILIWDQRPPCIEERMDDIISAAPGYSIEMCGSSEELESRIEGAEVVATVGLSAEAVAQRRRPPVDAHVERWCGQSRAAPVWTRRTSSTPAARATGA